MPAQIVTNLVPHVVTTYRNASDLPTYVWDALRNDPCASNIILPHAEKSRTRNVPVASSHTNFWIVCATPRPNGSPLVIDFVLSCTRGPLGDYPIFIYTPILPTHLHTTYVSPRLAGLVDALSSNVPPERVFSVFAFDRVSRLFAALWTKQTGVPLDRDPVYYAAKFSYCTRRTLRARPPTCFTDISYQLRPAVESDIPQAASLCYGFAYASEPFTLTHEKAFEEAALLVRNGQLWVHDVRLPGQAPEIASIVATTRTSETVAAITKVYTNPRWRKRGCAERLTRRVCEHLLKTKECVVLYVAHNNPAAATVYHRVGFVGLAPESAPVDGADSWLELGFERSMIELGHW